MFPRKCRNVVLTGVRAPLADNAAAEAESNLLAGEQALAEVEERVGKDAETRRLANLNIAYRIAEIVPAAGGEVVEDADFVASTQQRADDVGADEAGPAGHETTHVQTQLKRTVRREGGEIGVRRRLTGTAPVSDYPAAGPLLREQSAASRSLAS